MAKHGPVSDGLFTVAARRRLSLGVALAGLMGLSAGPLSAQTAPPASQTFQDRVQAAVRSLAASEPRLKRVPMEKRVALIEFVIGNMLYVSAHEVGHGIMAELEIPNIGRDEDAADSFAILTGLKVGSKFSERVLTEGARGWYLAEQKRKKEGEALVFYDEHGLNLQRAYQIVCFMVGSDAAKFKQLADRAKMPEARQKSCDLDFAAAAWSWETLLKPHLRGEAQPKQKIDIRYGEAKGKLEVYAKLFREIGFLENLAQYVGDRYNWPKPFEMVMESCGEPGAHWDSRKLTVCYEMAQEFAELYRDYGEDLKTPKAKAKGKAKSKRKR